MTVTRGFHLIIEGKIKTASFDPMNIIALEHKLLHNSFIKVILNEEEYLIQQPVITYIKDSIKDIKKLHLVLETEPIKNIDSITIDNIGEIKGEYKEQDNVLYLLVN